MKNVQVLLLLLFLMVEAIGQNYFTGIIRYYEDREDHGEASNSVESYFIGNDTIVLLTNDDLYVQVGLKRTVYSLDSMTKFVINDRLKLAAVDTFNEKYDEDIKKDKKISGWKVTSKNEQKVIMGYTCQKFVVSFKVAGIGLASQVHWVTNDLPLNYDRYSAKRNPFDIFNTECGISLEIETRVAGFIYTSDLIVKEIIPGDLAGNEVFKIDPDFEIISFNEDSIQRLWGLK